eukprot:TRINITY_DN4215_c0_g1_i8.p7 TRINITY_DN4215_c0_g1~~TRINITY_DN4215_c0_g1_i8.p7  ORF type:complete len:114 (+),score=3.80 TRINITY_DN4215_c0_g1_i8:325-666(+)
MMIFGLEFCVKLQVRTQPQKKTLVKLEYVLSYVALYQQLKAGDFQQFFVGLKSEKTRQHGNKKYTQKFMQNILANCIFSKEILPYFELGEFYGKSSLKPQTGIDLVILYLCIL